MKKIIIASLIYIMSSTGIAAEIQKATNTKSKSVEATVGKKEERIPSVPSDESKPIDPRIIKKADYIIEDSSRHNRMDKKYTAWAQLLGIGPSLASTTGLVFGYFHTSDDIFLVEITRGSADVSFFGSETYDIATRSVGLHWKHFTGNSFYLNTGIDFRDVDYDYNSTFNSTQSHFDATSTIISLTIGNQWQWENFTLGCDWVGISVPLTHDISNARITTASSYEQSEFIEDQETFSKHSHIQLLRFYLGASF